MDMTTKPVESSAIPPELMAELQEAVDRAIKGIRDPEIMRKACEEMDRSGRSFASGLARRTSRSS